MYNAPHRTLGKSLTGAWTDEQRDRSGRARRQIPHQALAGQRVNGHFTSSAWLSASLCAWLSARDDEAVALRGEIDMPDGQGAALLRTQPRTQQRNHNGAIAQRRGVRQSGKQTLFLYVAQETYAAVSLRDQRYSS